MYIPSALMVLWFGGSTLASLLFSIVYGGLVFAITHETMVPSEVLWYGQAANIPMVVVGKLIQVKRKKTSNFNN